MNGVVNDHRVGSVHSFFGGKGLSQEGDISGGVKEGGFIAFHIKTVKRGGEPRLYIPGKQQWAKSGSLQSNDLA